jgi:peptide-methionine (S)-S-oxide reductase
MLALPGASAHLGEPAMIRTLSLALLLATTLPASAAPAPPAPSHTEIAVFAGGCFWCMETQFEGVPGVTSVISGYTGGFKEHPTYEEVGAHTTGHLEAIQVTFDPTVVSYEKLLDRFWHGIDPTQGDGQFCDIGETYRSAIFARGEAQRQAAVASKERLEASHVLKAPIVTRILPAGVFWPAEDYHQDFWRKDPVRYHTYRQGCGRDRRLAQLWGAAAVKPLVH